MIGDVGRGCSDGGVAVYVPRSGASLLSSGGAILPRRRRRDERDGDGFSVLEDESV